MGEGTADESEPDDSIVSRTGDLRAWEWALDCEDVREALGTALLGSRCIA